MNFINKYINGETLTDYRYAQEFMETDIRVNKTYPVTYSAGHLNGVPLITKVDENGNLLWERVYHISRDGKLSFHKIIQVNAGEETPPVKDETKIKEGAAAAGDQWYVLYASNGENEHYLVCININGDVLWCNAVAWPDSDVFFYLEPVLREHAFYIVISDRNEIDTLRQPYIAKFNANGGFIHGNLLFMSNGLGMVINAAKSHNWGLTLVGRYLDADSHGLIIDLRSDLNISLAATINDIKLTFHDVEIYDRDYFLASGYLSDEKLLFVTSFSYDVRYDPMLIYPKTENHASGLCLGKEAFYFLQYTSQEGILHKYGMNLSHEWTKTLSLDTGPNGIRFVNFLDYQNTLTLTVAEGSKRPLLAHTDEQLESCKTQELDKPMPKDARYEMSLLDTFVKYLSLDVRRINWELLVNEPMKKECCPEGGGGGDEVSIDENTMVQSPGFYLQGAGSTGADGSARGIHLRWLFAGALGKKHLPKGDYAATSYNFNKPDDYVRLYRAPYIKAQVLLDFSAAPYLADDGNKVWLYRTGGKVFYVYFRNTAKYTQVRATFNPLQNPAQFVNAYGSELLEIENKKELFFAAEINVEVISPTNNLRTETLSVSENALGVSKVLTSRKTYTAAELNNVRLLCENGRSIRIRPSGCRLLRIYFECYSDFIQATNSRRGWQLMNKYALTLDDGTAFNRLEPSPALIDGRWQRYNDNALVNINNYHDKWNGPRESWDRNIKTVVQKYIDLSNAQNNPQALENVPLQSGAPPADDMLELSNLDLLNMSAYDFHVARMLGLGTLDISAPATEGQQFIYVAKYTTYGNLEDGDGARTVHHLSMTLPVSCNEQRMPYAVKLKEILPGAFWGTESPEPVNITDANGYTYDGRNRYVTIYSEQLPEDELNKPFYYTAREFNAATFTWPVYAGLEYKKNSETEWAKPELPNDPRYQNKVPAGGTPHNETFPLVLPEPQKPLFVHRQRVSGTHYYGSYGINWFSRAVSHTTVLSIITNIQPVNPLKPPTNINALLVRKEQPLLLTSADEQGRYGLIPVAQDHTLIRITFDYHTFQELIDYKIPLGANINDPNVIPADNTEIFADKVQVFFRNQVPGNVSGKALSVNDHPSNNILSVIQTGNYVMTSTGQTLEPVIAPPAAANNYVGGLFIMGDQQFIIHQVVLPTGSMQGPEFTVFKKEISNGIVTNVTPAPGAQNLEAPQIIPDGLFMAVENMQNASSWGTPNPLPLQVNIGTGWTVHREVITIATDDGPEQHLEKTRGFWDTANVQPEPEPVDVGPPVHKGLYKITFQNLVLPHHAQYDDDNVSADWYQGIIRIHTSLNPNAQRKTLKVLRMENLATANKLVLYAYDPSFVPDPLYDKIQIGIISVNYYPGYRLHLYTDAAYGLTEANILPSVNEDVHYSIFGLRSYDMNANYYSKISVPQLMFAQQQREPAQPEQPAGSLYATRPDFFGRATYTFTTKYQNRPHGVLTCRADDEALLNALYKQQTINAIRDQLKGMGGNDDPYFANRWKNFINFTEIYQDGDYKSYPPASPDGYKFPNPDNPYFFEWANDILTKLGQPNITETPGTLAAGHIKIREFVKGAIFNAFVPLTEIPVIFQHIKGVDYKPVPKKQVIRDRNGNVLKPMDAGFDMAPMMKITGGTGNETSFTDFTLDGTSNNIYFYGVRELNAQMQMSGFSPFLGPVKLVNTHPPEAPEIKRIMPVLENSVLGIDAGIQLEVNAYPEVQHVKKLNIYRAFSQLDAQSVRSMALIKTVDLEVEGVLTESIWTINDGFEDLSEIPYNDGLYYRITASRQIEYADMDGNLITEYAPSQPSKLTATLIVETYNPPAPVLTFISNPITPQGDLNNVKLKWDKTAYKAKYHVYKMNASGNWVKIHELATNDAHIELPLAGTDLQSGTIATKDANGNNIYSHFKVVTENTSGMLSLEENILTIPG